MHMHGIGSTVGVMRLFWLPAALAVIAACTTFGGEGGDVPPPVAEAGLEDAAAPPSDGPPPAVPDAMPAPDAGCRAPLARLATSSEVPVSSASFAALPNGDVVVAGVETCAGGTFGVYRVSVGQLPVRVACLGEAGESVAGIAADQTGVTVLTRYPAAGFQGSRLHRRKLDGTEREPVVSIFVAGKTTFPTAIARVGGRDVYATFDGTDSVLRNGSDARTLPLAAQVVPGLVSDGDRLLAVVTPSNTTGATELWLRRWTLAPNGTLIDDANFGALGTVSVAVPPSSASYTLFGGTSLATREGASALGIPVSGSATARFVTAGGGHTVGPVGAGVALVSVAHACDGALLAAHATSSQSGTVTRFARPATQTGADPAWQVPFEGRHRGLVTLPEGDFAVVAEIPTDAGLMTRISKLAR